MATRIELAVVTAHCDAEADEHRTLSLSTRDGRRAEHLAMAVMAERIADHFRAMAVASDDDVEIARRIDPDAFEAHAASVRRLIAAGHDERSATTISRTTHGERIDAALAGAAIALATARNEDSSGRERALGVDDALAWHAERAFEADRQAAAETDDGRRRLYVQRAERHRLYARRMRQDLARPVANGLDPSNDMEPQLPLQPPVAAAEDDGPSLAVLAAMRRGVRSDDGESV